MHELPQYALDDVADRAAELADTLATLARPARDRSASQPQRTAAAATSAPASPLRIRQLSIPTALLPTAAITGVVLLP